MDNKNKKQFIVKFRADDITISKLEQLCDNYDLTKSQVLRRLIDIGLFNESVNVLLQFDGVELMNHMPDNPNYEQIINDTYSDDSEVTIKQTK